LPDRNIGLVEYGLLFVVLLVFPIPVVDVFGIVPVVPRVVVLPAELAPVEPALDDPALCARAGALAHTKTAMETTEKPARRRSVQIPRMEPP
jgi:hypothetical protein